MNKKIWHTVKIKLKTRKTQKSLLMDLVLEDATQDWTGEECYLIVRCFEHDNCLYLKIDVTPDKFFRYRESLKKVDYFKLRYQYGERKLFEVRKNSIIGAMSALEDVELIPVFRKKR